MEPTTAHDFEPFPEDWSRALCIAAHPDDLEYGAAAAVARWTGQGKHVTYLLATSGEAGIDTLDPAQAGPLREQEERDGAAEVGVETVEFLGYPDGTVEYSLALRRDIADAIRRHQPEVVISLTHRERFVGGFTNQADHRNVGLAVLDATADAGNRWIFQDLTSAPFSGVRAVAYAGSAEPTHQVDVSATFEPAVRSLEAHGEYLAALGPDYPSPRELLGSILADGVLTFEVFGR